MAKHYVNETGTDLILDCGINLGTADEYWIEYQKPDGSTEGSFAASLYDSYSALAETTGTFFLKHTLVRTDLDVAGDWIFQAYVGAVDGTWYGESVKQNILNKFE